MYIEPEYAERVTLEGCLESGADNVSSSKSNG